MKLPPALVALTPGELGPRDVPDLVARVRSAAGAGLRGVLVRERRLCDRDALLLLRTLGELRARWPELWIGAHDRVHLAAAGGADAVHLGFRSLALQPARGRFGNGLAWGLSTHAGDDPRSWDGADYLFHGPVARTPSKAGWQEPVGLEGLRAAVAEADVPVLAIGGLRPAQVAGVLEAGARGLAVLSGILPAVDPAGATRAYLDALGSRGA